MMHMLMYYFDNPCQELFGERIICVDGDITSKEQVEKFADYKFNTIINCAACVKHFANSFTAASNSSSLTMSMSNPWLRIA